ncbi:MAG TPA: DUF177 domain-containing protein [Pyrinomonadaceae bacterium]|nr:DUF177 domain-containing protein [Pyrinomonadaceae bacterium]
MRIEVESLTAEGKPFEQTYAPGALSLEDEHATLASGVRAWGRASRKGEEVRVRGSLQTSVELHCDRCLGPVPVPVNVDFVANFVRPSEPTAEARELHDEDLEVSVYDGDSVDLDEIVREQILLALPARQLCREDCKGLCPTCGKNLNAESCDCARHETDPRWAALADLKQSNG